MSSAQTYVCQYKAKTFEAIQAVSFFDYFRSLMLRSCFCGGTGCMLVEIATGAPLFPGESDIDQLWHIIKCFGTVSPGHRAFMAASPVRAVETHS